MQCLQYLNGRMLKQEILISSLPDISFKTSRLAHTSLAMTYYYCVLLSPPARQSHQSQSQVNLRRGILPVVAGQQRTRAPDRNLNRNRFKYDQ